ncbi:MAG: glycosyltransferase family 2 protein [Lentisphaeria bacterium]|nr:glycosyltransferase family 2 protein [Lentisphaeria bacterium]
MKNSIIILNYNSSTDCRKCIADLQRQRGIDFNIIVVDNASRPDDVAVLQDICAENSVILIKNTHNKGYSAGNNIGLRYAAESGTEFALIVNPDMEFPNPDYLITLRKKFDDDNDIVVVASDILHHDGYHQNPMKPDRGWKTGFDFLRALTKRSSNFSNVSFMQSQVCEKVSGCCFMIRMDFLQEIGFFDEYPFLYCEEAILAAQVKQLAKKMFYIAEVQAIHNHIKNTKSNAVRRMKEWRRSRIYFQKKYAKDNFFFYILGYFLLHVYFFALISAKFRKQLWK